MLWNSKKNLTLGLCVQQYILMCRYKKMLQHAVLHMLGNVKFKDSCHKVGSENTQNRAFDWNMLMISLQ